MPGSKAGLAVESSFARVAWESHATSAAEAISLIASAWLDMAGSWSDLRRHLLCRNVYESMEQYTKVELLEGENQYKAEGFGMQVRLALTCCTQSSSQGACSSSMAYWATACKLLVAGQHHAHGHPQHAAQPAVCTASIKQRASAWPQDCQNLLCCHLSLEPW